ncbi:MAG: hypothetical protein DRP12_00100 [Candidatus Aenigmatarchaeota archaeon]|nr:MAG: hypothetical protein DRP12_00100 [Candidatus Aenigmarchaeota archaeon]
MDNILLPSLVTGTITAVIVSWITGKFPWPEALGYPKIEKSEREERIRQIFLSVMASTFVSGLIFSVAGPREAQVQVSSSPCREIRYGY